MLESLPTNMREHMKAVRFGLIGHGAWGSHHARAIHETPGAELRAIAVQSATTCQAARSAFPDVAVYDDLQSLLAREDLDVIDVVLPSHLHYQAGKAALKSGRHLLLEKPMALELGHCDDLIALAGQKNKVLAIGHEMRLSALWGKVKSMIDAGAVGDPLYLLVELWRRQYRPGAGGWRYDQKRVGNWILEEPIHFLDLASWYLAGAGMPVTIYARANSKQQGHPELQDNFSALLTFSTGAYAVISQTLTAFEHHQVVKIAGSKGSLWAAWSGAMDRDLLPRFSLKYHDGEKVADITPAAPSGEIYELREEIAAMVAAVRDGKPVAATGADGRQSVALCLAAQESIASEKEIEIGEFLRGK